jgi:hypothetical protein
MMFDSSVHFHTMKFIYLESTQEEGGAVRYSVVDECTWASVTETQFVSCRSSLSGGVTYLVIGRFDCGRTCAMSCSSGSGTFVRTYTDATRMAVELVDSSVSLCNDDVAAGGSVIVLNRVTFHFWNTNFSMCTSSIRCRFHKIVSQF